MTKLSMCYLRICKITYNFFFKDLKVQVFFFFSEALSIQNKISSY